MKTTRERAEAKRVEKLALVREQVESGSLVIRQMTEEERRQNPPRPVAPKRFLLTAAGFGIGFALGLLLAGVFEVPRLFTIQTADDAKHYTNLPVLVTIPELLTAAEARAIPRRHKLAMAAGFALTIVAMPTLAFVLRLTHVLERFLI